METRDTQDPRETPDHRVSRRSPTADNSACLNHNHNNTYAESHIGSTATKPGAAADKTAQNKTDKCPNWPAHIFYPFAVETAGTWHEMAIELTQEIGRRITTITENTRETTFATLINAFPWLCKEESVSFHTMVTE